MDVRKYTRYAVQLPVTLLADPASGNQVLGEGAVYNLSGYGCKIASEVVVQTGDYLGLYLHLPAPEARVKVEVAAVRWAMGIDMGLEFIATLSEDRVCLHRFVKTLEEKEKWRPLENEDFGHRPIPA